jgi:hypothetical protein
MPIFRDPNFAGTEMNHYGSLLGEILHGMPYLGCGKRTQLGMLPSGKEHNTESKQLRRNTALSKLRMR